jgi:hypothetical protein
VFICSPECFSPERKREDDGYFLILKVVSERMNDASIQGDLLNTMGIIEWGQVNYSKALDYYQRALMFRRSKQESFA